MSDNKQNIDNNVTNLLANDDESTSILENIDFNKIREIIFKSLIWVILINILTILAAYLYIKYQKPLYQSSSLLKLTVENEKVVSKLDFLIPEGQGSDDNLLGEIEIVRSNIVLGTVAETAKNIKVSYFAKGNFVDKEMYGYSPFRVEYQEKETSTIYDKKINLNIISSREYEITIGENKYKYRFGKDISLFGEKVKIIKTSHFGQEFINLDYYFIVNSRNALIRYLQKNLIVGEQNKKAKTFSIGFKEYEQHKARDIVNLIDSVYIEKTREEKNKSNVSTLAFVEKKIKEYKDSLDKYENLLQSFFLENRTKDIDAKVEKAIEELEELSKQRSIINRKLSNLVELQTSLENEDNLVEDEYYLYQIENPAMTSILSNLREKLLERKRLEVRVKAGSGTTKEQGLNIEIAQLKKDLKNLIRASKQAVRGQMEEINEQLGKAQGILQNLPNKGGDYANINQQYQVYKSYYDQFFNLKVSLMVAQAGVVPKSILLSPANLPTKSIGTPSFIIYGIAVFLGFFLSAGVIIIRYLLHDTVTNQKELERFVKAPILGVIPLYRKHKLEHTKLVVDKNPKSSLNEAIRDIRTNLEFMLPNDKGLYDKENTPLLSVTSTISGEGKTFVVSNLGGVIAMADIKVVILDFDMRKPKLHLAFGEENEKGVSTILIGKTSVEECIQKTQIKNLDFISSGPTPPNPSELILREDFDIMLDELKTLYDVIMIDTPPVGLVTDAMLIMKKVDLPMYIVKANYSKKVFTRNINRLYKKEFKHISVVLNAVKHTKSYGYYYGGYYGAYGYGSGYYTDDDEPKPSLVKRITNIFRFKRKRK